MGKLSGMHIAVTGPRCESEFRLIAHKLGGMPSVYAAQGTVYSDADQLETQLRELMDNPVDWLILTTGIGTDALVMKAEELGMREELLAVMSKARIAARGYKTVNALRKHGIDATVKADDGTTDGIYRALADYSLAGARIALQLYGDPSPRIAGRLRAAGAECMELLPYIHIMPDPAPIDELIDRCLFGTMDAVVLTSTVQARCIFHRARETNKERELLAAFETRVLGVAVGKITAEAMNEEGMNRVIYPEEERLGPAIIAAGRWFEERGGALASDLENIAPLPRALNEQSASY